MIERCALTLQYVHVVQVAGVLTQYDAMVEMQEEEADKSLPSSVYFLQSCGAFLEIFCYSDQTAVEAGIK